MPKSFWRGSDARQVLHHAFIGALIAGALLYLGVYIAVAKHAYGYIAQPELNIQNPVVVVLGNRARIKGVPNLCLIGRVDKGMDVLRHNNGQTLLVSGGMDPIEQRFESQVMAEHALKKGFSGRLIQEQRSTTTFENLKFSTPLLLALGAKTVVIVSEPHHLWRASLLAHAQGMDKLFDLHFVAAETQCWTYQGIFFTGALQEPLAWVKNLLQGHY